MHEHGMHEHGQYTLRPMRLEDVDSVYAIELDSFTLPWSRESLAEEASGANQAHVLIAEDEDKNLLGYAGFRQVLDEGHITNIAVAHNYRGRGVGKFLMKGLLDECRSLGIIYVLLEVRVSNKAAIHIYERAGFTVAGIRRGYYEIPREDAVIMCKKLDEE